MLHACTHTPIISCWVETCTTKETIGSSLKRPVRSGSPVAASSPVSVLPLGLRGAHVTASATPLVLFCAVVPTGVLGHRKIVMISNSMYYPQFTGGELTGLYLWSFAIDDMLSGLSHFTKLADVNLRRTQITDAGLVQLEGLTNLQRLFLPTQVTDVASAPSGTLRPRGCCRTPPISWPLSPRASAMVCQAAIRPAGNGWTPSHRGSAPPGCSATNGPPATSSPLG